MICYKGGGWDRGGGPGGFFLGDPGGGAIRGGGGGRGGGERRSAGGGNPPVARQHLKLRRETHPVEWGAGGRPRGGGGGLGISGDPFDGRKKKKKKKKPKKNKKTRGFRGNEKPNWLWWEKAHSPTEGGGGGGAGGGRGQGYLGLGPACCRHAGAFSPHLFCLGGKNDNKDFSGFFEGGDTPCRARGKGALVFIFPFRWAMLGHDTSARGGAKTGRGACFCNFWGGGSRRVGVQKRVFQPRAGFLKYVSHQSFLPANGLTWVKFPPGVGRLRIWQFGGGAISGVLGHGLGTHTGSIVIGGEVFRQCAWSDFLGTGGIWVFPRLRPQGPAGIFFVGQLFSPAGLFFVVGGGPPGRVFWGETGAPGGPKPGGIGAFGGPLPDSGAFPSDSKGGGGARGGPAPGGCRDNPRKTSPGRFPGEGRPPLP